MACFSCSQYGETFGWLVNRAYPRSRPWEVTRRRVHRVDGKYYITGTPGRSRSWYADLASLPGFASTPGPEPEIWVARSPLVEVTSDN